MPGLRVHITGSAAADCDDALSPRAHLSSAHSPRRLIHTERGLVVGAGGEPG